MKQEEFVWYESKSLDGTYRQIFDKDYFKHFDSVEETRKALDQYIKEYHHEGVTYIICKVTSRKFHDDAGRFIRNERFEDAVEYYPN